MTLLLAAYRLLAWLGAERAVDGQEVDVHTWEQPWVRHIWSSEQSKLLRVKLPAGAVLKVRGRAAEKVVLGSQRVLVLLIPDLGTAPVARHREMLRRLVGLRETQLEDNSVDTEPEVVVASVDPDRQGTRGAAWLELLNRVGRRREQPALLSRVVSWEQVANVVERVRLPVVDGSGPDRRCRRDSGTVPLRAWRAPAHGREQLLHLIGRHPLLTVGQLVQLLGTTPARVERLEQELVDSGWLRRIEFDKLPDGATGLKRDAFGRLGLLEITLTGRRRLATWLGLEPAAATRYHGLIGNRRGQAGRRRRLLRTLPHTLGANAVFVAFAVAAEAVRRQGGTDELVEWRSAAACERRHCKPDGYGCYVRDGLAHGFFLEYDRGTEPARKYASKLGAYYRYRDSGQAMRDYVGFPTLLFVTTDASAEERIAQAAYRAWFIRGVEPLPILIATTSRIAAHREGILAPIWRTPAPSSSPDASERMYWLPGGPPRGLFANGQRVATPQLVWPGARITLRDAGCPFRSRVRSEPAALCQFEAIAQSHEHQPNSPATHVTRLEPRTYRKTATKRRNR